MLLNYTPEQPMPSSDALGGGPSEQASAFEQEQELYRLEGIQWKMIEYKDNSPRPLTLTLTLSLPLALTLTLSLPLALNLTLSLSLPLALNLTLSLTLTLT